MDAQRDQTNAIDRFAEAIRSRRALLGGGLAALGLAVFASDDQDAVGKRSNRQRHRQRRNRRRRRRGGQDGPGAGDCYVCPSGCRFSTIQEAIENPPENAVITVCPGTYKERLTYNPVGAIELTIVGSGANETIIDGDGGGSVVTAIGGIRLELAEFTITGGKAAFGGGVFNRGNLSLKNCIVTGNDTGAADDSAGGGIYNERGDLALTETEVSDNHALDGRGGGIFVAGGTVSLGLDTLVTKNMADQGGGIFNQGGTVTVDLNSRVIQNEPNNCVGTSACGA